MIKDRIIKHLQHSNISEKDIQLVDVIYSLSGLDKVEYIENPPLFDLVPLKKIRKSIGYNISQQEIMDHVIRMSQIPYPDDINATFNLYLLRSLNEEHLSIVYIDTIEKLFGITPEKAKFSKLIRKIEGELAIMEKEFPEKTKELKEFLLKIENEINMKKYDDTSINNWIHYIENNFILGNSIYILDYGKELSDYLKTKIFYNFYVRSNLKNLMEKHHIKSLSELSRRLKDLGIPISRTSLNKIYHDNHLEKNKLETFIKLKIFFNCTFDDLFQ